MGSTLKALRKSPEEVKDGIGYALELVQKGEKPANAKPLKGFRGASVLEIVEDFGGDTWRAVYTVAIADAVYVLHFLQKRSKKGIATPKQEIDLVKKRLREAMEHGKAGRA
jgi:phage-related protein